MVFSHHWKKSDKKLRVKDESEIFPIKSGKKLISGSKHAQIIDRLITHTRLEKDKFNELYLDLIENFFEFCQSIPSKDNQASIHANIALSRACSMVEQVGQKIVKVKNGFKEYESLRLLYAIFSSALLNGIGHIDRDRLISITDDKGYHLSNWCPLAMGAMPIGKHYRLRYMRSHNEQYAAMQTPMVAKSIMPDAGLVWIAENDDLFVSWVRSLHHFEDGYSDFELLHDIKDLWEKCHKVDAIKSVVAEPINIKELAEAEAFWQWLRENLEKGKIEFNKENSPAHVVEDGGISIDLERVYADFKKTYPDFSGWVVVSRQFNHLGVAPLSGQDLRYQQYFKVEQANKDRSFGIYKANENSMKIPQNLVYFANISNFVNPAAIPKEPSLTIVGGKGSLIGNLIKSLLSGLLVGNEPKIKR